MDSKSPGHSIELLTDPDASLVDFLEEKIDEFNWERWEVKERKPLAVQIRNSEGDVIAGAAGRTFGNWLLLDTLWVSDELRGARIGSELLEALETAAQERGCTKCLLDTLNFQAQPFYKRHGYNVVWIQEDYPLDGCKYFMVKSFEANS